MTRIARLAALGAACVALAAAAQSGRPAEPVRADAARLMNELMAGNGVGGPFVLADQDGRLVGPADWHGKLSLLYFGYLFCPDACPSALGEIASAIRALGAEGARVQPVFVTLDPTRDVPKLRGDYARAFDSRFVALGGSEDDVRRVALAYKVFYEKVFPQSGSNRYLIDHSSFTYVLDADGRYVGYFPPGTGGKRMAEQLRALLAK